MSTVKTDSHVSSKYEASLVKCYDPGCIILDIHYKDRNMVAETEQIKLFNQDITKYWNTHKDDPVEGRRYHLGEVSNIAKQVDRFFFSRRKMFYSQCMLLVFLMKVFSDAIFSSMKFIASNDISCTFSFRSRFPVGIKGI
ncbi:Protein of unknown function [Gryllus bimaculatus]|nr:Protein of unknown function [Gryllus bimaculatus]